MVRVSLPNHTPTHSTTYISNSTKKLGVALCWKWLMKALIFIEKYVEENGNPTLHRRWKRNTKFEILHSKFHTNFPIAQPASQTKTNLLTSWKSDQPQCLKNVVLDALCAPLPLSIVAPPWANTLKMQRFVQTTRWTRMRPQPVENELTP